MHSKRRQRGFAALGPKWCLPHTPPLRLQGAMQKERAGKLDEPEGLDDGKETLSDTTGPRHTYELAATGEAHTEPMQMPARCGCCTEGGMWA